jgi:hypothetical protein
MADVGDRVLCDPPGLHGFEVDFPRVDGVASEDAAVDGVRLQLPGADAVLGEGESSAAAEHDERQDCDHHICVRKPLAYLFHDALSFDRGLQWDRHLERRQNRAD